MQTKHKYPLCSLLFMAVIGSCFSALAVDAAVDSQKQKCQDALSTAMATLQRRADNQAVIAPASTNQNDQSQAQSPMAEAMNKLAEGQSKLAEIEQQRIQKQVELGSNQLKDLIGYKNKFQELRQENAKACMEMVDVETNKAKADMKVRRGCQDYADRKYDELLNKSAGKASVSQLKMRRGGKLKGQRKSMHAMKGYYLQECMCKPQTQEAFAMNMTELAAKVRQNAIKNEMILSEKENLDQQLPATNADYETKRAAIDAGAAIGREAVARSNMMQTIGLLAGVATASNSAEEGANIAGSTASAMQTLENFTTIEAVCTEEVEQNKKGIYVPSDVYPIFASVNKECRVDQSPSRYCVQNSGQQSTELRNSLEK